MKKETAESSNKEMEQVEAIDLGWNPFFANNFEPYRKQGFKALRITRENREKYIACSELGEFICEVTGKFRFEAGSKIEFPTVGDWVVASAHPNEEKATIHALLPRKSIITRKAAGTMTVEQVVAANIDILFIVCGLDLNYNLRRIERYLSLTWESGVTPVILLSKSDLCAESEDRREEVESIAPGVDVHAISVYKKSGMAIFGNYVQTGKTAAFIGSSGVGKSTMINSLLGTERLKVGEVSEIGSRGKHTTTFRELILLPGGGMVIDTPGMRELQVWGEEEGLKQAFDDIEDLAVGCRFTDCKHQSEPGCAVQKAIDDGALDPDRLNSYFKLKTEFAQSAKRQTTKASATEKARLKTIARYKKNSKNTSKT